MKSKSKILFLCTGNSCRSQMAEGFAKKYLFNDFEPYSAGIIKSSLNSYAQRVMSEIGIDISKQYSKEVSELKEINFDFVVTLCDNARDTCPNFQSSGKVVHKSFDDPPALTKDIKEEKEKLKIYRKVRDEIYDFVKYLPDFLKNN